MNKQTKLLAEELAQLIDSEKGEQIEIIDLAGKTDIADYMIVASGLNRRHVGAMGEKIAKFMKDEKNQVVTVEGLENAEWVLIDCLDVIIHVFQPEIRDQYQIEQLWNIQLERE
ncbi:MAG: ribosome silencing factor [Alphaproteobacteria bacterium]|nr:ribosome silencing factor [Alphaproteobacteria bacterium]OJV13574.1 MAG: ribosome silencing factor [Alphaproteobacteria bacterium 33-17]